MNLKSRTAIWAVLAAGFVLTVNVAGTSEADPFPAIVLPVYPGAYDQENSFNRAKGTKALLYKVQTDYRAAEVLEFYDADLNGRGWKPSFETCQRHWASLADGSLNRGFQARQLFTSWEHPQYRLQLSLLLEYQPPGPDNRGEVTVRCRLQPQLDYSKQAEFMERLKAAGQYRAFAKKLDAYRKPDGEVDQALIGRDIRNGNADENLIEYQRILDETKQQIDAIIRRVNDAR